MTLLAIIAAVALFMVITGGYEAISKLVSFAMVASIFLGIIEFFPFSPLHGQVIATIASIL